LAQALIHGPTVLILDEPTNGLDPAAREDMLGLIRSIVRDSESKVIISSHLLQDIETCCQDVLVLRKGHLVAAGNIEEMRHTETNLFELRIKGNLDPFMAQLSDMQCECRLTEREILQVRTPDSMDPQRLFAVAKEQRVQIRHFYAKKDTLEDIFLKVLESDELESARSKRI
jgi:ABC-2 type transport system ATP-binding protein